MRAMRLHAPAPIATSPLRLDEVPEPEPRPGEVRIRIAACGVCRTDLHEVEGEIPLSTLPVTPGHQATGVVDAVGDGVDAALIGDRVGVAWMHATCGACTFCVSGAENLCENARFTGVHADGGYAEAMVAPAPYTYALPARVDDLHATSLLCAGVIGYRAARIADVAHGERVGLIGFGNSAHITLQVLRHWGCEVHVFTRSDAHRAHATELGAASAGGLDDAAGPRDLDRVLVFAPAGRVVAGALARLRRGGVAALAGVTMTDLPAMPYALLYGERVLRSVTNATRRDATELLALASEVPIRTEVEAFPLERANDALARVKASALTAGAAVVP